MNRKRRYWLDEPEAPYAQLLRTIHAYCHPEVDNVEQLAKQVREYPSQPRLVRFRQQLREALEGPFDAEDMVDGELSYHLDYTAEYGDGNDRRYLRRLWRDVFPDEPVPGGDEEFRDDLRRTIAGELDRIMSTTWHYIPLTTKTEDLPAAARQVWARFYPDEPIPDGPG